MSSIVSKHIAVTSDVCGGKPRIAGRRITVQDVVIWHERQGRSPDEIATEYDLTLAEVHAAMTYYFDHREEIDEQMRSERKFAEEFQNQCPSLLTQRVGR
ncbi:MAG: DUF433 domain-containing protein [Acidobacteria bacterium]|nr:DUF433 domain-containing protein [Acidobacteriota bacterium]